MGLNFSPLTTTGETMPTAELQEAVGVIVARFQVPELHKGHRYTLDYVLERHHQVLVILGVAPVLSGRNPLSFEMRKLMIESMYPQSPITIIPSDSLPSSYGKRSRKIDDLIEKAFPGREAVIYGARDSFIHSYTGKFETSEVPTVFLGSATEVRQSITPINSADFRAGVIYALSKRKAQGYPTVDVAVVNSNGQVLLVQKNDEEGKLRFPGVFFNPEVDDSYEAAGARCLSKELPYIITRPLKILGSTKIKDWRFKKTMDSVVTLFMVAEYVDGEITPGAGVDGAKWEARMFCESSLVTGHKPLAAMLKPYVFGHSS